MNKPGSTRVKWRMQPIPTQDTTASRCREQEAVFRRLLNEQDVLVSDDLMLSNTRMRFDVAETTGGKGAWKGRLRFRLNGGRHVHTYTCRQGAKGFNFPLIVQRTIDLYKRELELTRNAEAADRLKTQSVEDADAINNALGLEPHHFPRVRPSGEEGRLIISMPEGLTRDQAEAALKAIYAHAPRDPEDVH